MTTTRTIRSLIAVLAALALAVALLVGGRAETAGASSGSQISQFIGLWAGISAGDGSLFHTSVADSDGDGIAEILMHDTVWTICGDIPALVSGTGTADGGTLTTVISIACEDGQLFEGITVTYDRIAPSLLEIGGPVPPGAVHRVSTR